jgi:hypothetical protein
MKKLLSNVYNYGYKIGIIFLLAFIPLYPKLPLLDIKQTWVYIRLEDFIIAIIYGLFVLSMWKKGKWKPTPLHIPIFLYLTVGLVSLLNSLVLIGPHLSNFVPKLALLHYFRRIEYMGLFFVAYETFQEKKFRTIAYWTLGITLLLVVIYGFGQKFMGWPAFLTMNEEFAKGIPLRLPPTARMTSLFAGHYDLAAYLVLLLPIIGCFLFNPVNIFVRLCSFIIIIGGYVMLLYTQSRVSFGAFLIAFSVMLFWKRKYILIPLFIFASIYGMRYVTGASDRYMKTLRFSDVIVDLSTGRPIGTLEKMEGGSAVVEKQESPAEESLPKGSEFIGIPTAPTEPQKIVRQIRTIERFKSTDLSTGSGEIATVSGSYLIQKAFVFDISITTRSQGQWPMAIEAWKRNILLGSGYSSLSIAADSDYMRMLGETGILGSIAFLGIFIMFFKVKQTYVDDHLSQSLVLAGIGGGLIGLMLNATLIDVFEASKVAYPFWIILGLGIAIVSDKKRSYPPYITVLWDTLTHPLAIAAYITLIVFWIFRQASTLYFLGDDFTWLKWAADTYIPEIPQYFTNAAGFFYRPIPKLWYYILYSFFWLIPMAYHIMSLFLLSLISFGTYILLLQQRIKKWIAFMIVILFAGLSIHHENVFWISGQSSLLSALFAVWAIVFVLRKQRTGIFEVLRYILVITCIILSMFSYEGAIILPIIILLFYTFYTKKINAFSIFLLVLLPFVWWVRIQAHAVPPSGDYGVNLKELPFNILGNGIGYLVSIFIGPKAVDWFWNIRAFIRTIPRYILVLGFGGIVTTLYVTYVKKFTFWKTIQPYVVNVWTIAFCLSLIPYIGLGNITERYVLFPSVLGIVAIGITIQSIVVNSKTWVTSGIIIVIFGCLFSWNIIEIQRLGTDWKKASDIVEQSLLIMKKQYFPLLSDTRFVIVNQPIRYGRAWVYPTGMNDALWHMFKFGSQKYDVVGVSTIVDAFNYPTIPTWAKYELVFENYVLKKAVKEVETVEIVDENSK